MAIRPGWTTSPFGQFCQKCRTPTASPPLALFTAAQPAARSPAGLPSSWKCSSSAWNRRPPEQVLPSSTASPAGLPAAAKDSSRLSTCDSMGSGRSLMKV